MALRQYQTLQRLQGNLQLIPNFTIWGLDPRLRDLPLKYSVAGSDKAAQSDP
ncbi:hypothetical protein PAXRUDRAFT_824775 [Paxillus rubicundulus Ve08.2h10]|uniref:Uncharacterized protein n=1 Tax=Paxillus rubicundulus Ve08.2h10 TaxID=930991 RepID=A0A0D0E7D2_9AGAM|nr:hypothetical protein PAXRUDRAFT_824775 [Paxillus rubicundulus Ve08.2h10]